VLESKLKTIPPRVYCHYCGRRRAEATCDICNQEMCLDCVNWVDGVGMVCKECYLDMKEVK